MNDEGFGNWSLLSCGRVRGLEMMGCGYIVLGAFGSEGVECQFLRMGEEG